MKTGNKSAKTWIQERQNNNFKTIYAPTEKKYSFVKSWIKNVNSYMLRNYLHNWKQEIKKFAKTWLQERWKEFENYLHNNWKEI